MSAPLEVNPDPIHLNKNDGSAKHPRGLSVSRIVHQT